MFSFFSVSHIKILENWFILVHFAKSLFLFFFAAYRTAVTTLALLCDNIAQMIPLMSEKKAIPVTTLTRWYHLSDTSGTV